MRVYCGNRHRAIVIGLNFGKFSFCNSGFVATVNIGYFYEMQKMLHPVFFTEIINQRDCCENHNSH